MSTNGSTGQTTSTSTYIDIDSLTSQDFSPYNHAATLIQRTNNPSDPSIDLTTPLSRVLFDLQEIDSHIHTLTSRSALDILNYTKTQNQAGQRILERVEDERTQLNASYSRLEKEVISRYDKAKQAQTDASRSWEVLRLIRTVQRVLNVARQFETAIVDSGLGAARTGKEDHRALLRASHTLLAFRDILSSQEGSDLGRINLVRTVRGRIFEDGEARVLDFARRIVREFAMSNLTGPAVTNSTFRDAEDNRARFTSAVHILFLLSPAPKIDGQKMKHKDFEPDYMLRALQSYLQSAITSSSAAIGRALSQLPLLERTMIEVSARCQNIVALEALLRSIQAPVHPLLQNIASNAKAGMDIAEEEIEDVPHEDEDNLLDPLLHSLDTSSLPSYFWRSLASSLTARVQDIVNRGGVSARTLRTQKDMVRAEIRECVLRGSKMPQSVLGTGSGGEEVIGNWEREAAVMVGSVIGALGR
jgi:Golgi transport complex subunit 5